MNFLTNDINTVNDSVSFLIDTLPLKMKEIAYTFRKYTQLIESRIENVSNYKSGILLQDMCNTTGIPFTKLLLELDAHAFTDLHLFLRNLTTGFNTWENNAVNQQNYPSGENGGMDHMGNTSSKEIALVNGEVGRVCIDSIMFKHMSTPHLQLIKFINGTNMNNFTYDIKNKAIPLKVTPKIKFDAIERKPDSMFWQDPIEQFKYKCDRYRNSKEIDIFGVGTNHSHIYCDVIIDIESIFTVLFNWISEYHKGLPEKEYDYLKENKLVTDEDHEREHIDNLLWYLHRFNNMTDEQFEEMFINGFVLDDLTRRMTYSAITTFLATVTKVEDSNRTFISEVCDSVLSNSVSTLYDMSYPTYNQEYSKKGALIRLLSSNTGSLLQAVLSSKNEFTNTGKKGIFDLIRLLIEDIYALQYTTWNYIKGPCLIDKFKKTFHICELAKKTAYHLDQNNKIWMSTAHDFVNDREGKLLSVFCNMDAIKIDGTYPNHKRYYDIGRMLLQQICALVLVRYRISSLDSFEEYDTDELNMNVKEYVKTEKLVYNKVCRAAGQLLKFVLLNCGRDSGNSLVNFNSEMNYRANNNHDKKHNLKEFIFGITNETIIADTILDSKASDFSFPLADPKRKNRYVYPPVKEIWSSMNKITRHCNGEDPMRKEYSFGLCGMWENILRTRVLDVIDYPYSPLLLGSSFTVQEICEGWGMAGNDASFSRPSVRMDEEPVEGWHQTEFDTMTQIAKQQSSSMAHLSLEDLNEIFKYLKKSKEDHFGLNYAAGTDPEGMFHDTPANYDFTLGLTNALDFKPNVEQGIEPNKEPEDDETVQVVSGESKNLLSLEDLTRRFDKWLGKTYG